MNNRTLDNDFEKDLRFGILHELLEYVQNDDTLMLATRGTSINIYYRGGSILKIEQNTSGKLYTATFDSSYAEGTPLPSLPQILTSADDVRTWLEVLPCLKHVMDVYLHKKRSYEREIQQYIVRENNHSPSSEPTDYFVADIEIVENKQIKCRFDMLAFCWDRSKRSRGREVSLALVELKYGVGNLEDESGIVEHYQQYVDLVKNADELEKLYEYSQKQINQLVRLGIFNHHAVNENFQVKVLEEQPEFILVFASNNVYSKKLESALSELERHPDFTKYKDKVKFYIGIAGYALYQKSLCNIDEFKSRILYE